MIVLFTDYGTDGPYLGQVHARLETSAPGIPVVNLFNDAPRACPRAAAYLLSAYARGFAPETVFFCVVDPGVGGAADLPVVLRVDDRWFVGPDNGLFDVAARHGSRQQFWRLTWRPATLSATFHGRDLYAPVCAMLAKGQRPPMELLARRLSRDWPADLREIVYIDHFGNSMTGLRSSGVAQESVLRAGGAKLRHADTFSRVPKGWAFWYPNSNGLVEIAVNRGSAAELLGLRIGSRVKVGRK
jgi:S-adenosylmethionine hydrolase